MSGYTDKDYENIKKNVWKSETNSKNPFNQWQSPSNPNNPFNTWKPLTSEDLKKIGEEVKKENSGKRNF